MGDSVKLQEAIFKVRVVPNVNLKSRNVLLSELGLMTYLERNT